jgi:hypothetical protein
MASAMSRLMNGSQIPAMTTTAAETGGQDVALIDAPVHRLLTA